MSDNYAEMQRKVSRLVEVGKQEVGATLPRPDHTKKREKKTRYAK